MATNFPTSLDSLSNPSGTDVTGLTTGQSNVTHSQQHTNANDAIEALQAKVGADSSAVTSSLDYKVTNASSSNPGHKHTLAQGATDVTASAAELNVLDGIPVTLTATELGYVDGVTSAIQTQLNAKTRTFSKVVAPSGVTTEADYYCDGTDDDVQIQAAIDAVSTAGGGTVFLRNGTYIIGSPVDISSKNNLSIIGESRDGTIISAKNAFPTDNGLIEATTVSNLFISSLTIDGNSAGQTTQEHNGIDINGGSYNTIYDVRLYDINFTSNWGSGIYLASQNSIISHCFASLCEYGIYLDSSNNSIVSCITEQNSYGVYVAASYSSITSCVSISNTSIGFYSGNIDNSFSGCTAYLEEVSFKSGGASSTFLGCTAAQSNSYGFYFNSLGNIASGCLADSGSSSGFYVTSASNCLASCIANVNLSTGFDITGGDCSITGCSSYGNITGISLSTGNNNVVSGSTITENVNHGINCDSSNNTISGNNISSPTVLAVDNTYSGILIGNSATSTRNVITGNRINGDGATNDYAYGIREQAAADDYNLVVGNIVTGADTAQISLQGSNSVSANNITA